MKPRQGKMLFQQDLPLMTRQSQRNMSMPSIFKDSGHYHSNWLSMMYPRLFLAKNLLRDDGVDFKTI